MIVHRVPAADYRVLWVLATIPGLDGLSIAKYLALPTRSHVQDQLTKLVNRGWVEDRRERKTHYCPAQFHLTDAGREAWEKIKP